MLFSFKLHPPVHTWNIHRLIASLEHTMSANKWQYITVVDVILMQSHLTKDATIKVHGANMGPTWGRQDPGRPHLATWTWESGDVCVDNPHCTLKNIFRSCHRFYLHLYKFVTWLNHWNHNLSHDRDAVKLSLYRCVIHRQTNRKRRYWAFSVKPWRYGYRLMEC